MSEVTATPVTKNDSNIMGAISYLWLLSIVMYFVKKDDSFVRFHAKQGMVLAVISIVLSFIPVIGWIVNLGVFIMMIIGAVKAYQGQKYALPVIGSIAEKINF